MTRHSLTAGHPFPDWPAPGQTCHVDVEDDGTVRVASAFLGFMEPEQWAQLRAWIEALPARVVVVP